MNKEERYAGLVELADTSDLSSDAVRRRVSSTLSRTKGTVWFWLVLTTLQTVKTRSFDSKAENYWLLRGWAYQPLSKAMFFMAWSTSYFHNILPFCTMARIYLEKLLKSSSHCAIIKKKSADFVKNIVGNALVANGTLAQKPYSLKIADSLMASIIWRLCTILVALIVIGCMRTIMVNVT